MRLSVSAQVNASRHLALLFEATSENMDARVRALYLRVTPWASRAVDLQIGLVPPVFGAFPRRAYGSDGPLIGFPLVYQYLTTMRADAFPAGANDLLAVRGRGWSVPYPSGIFPPGSGVPVVSSTRWDTGAQLRAGRGKVEAALSVTRGSLCDPVVEETNEGLQVSGRLAVRPWPELTVGVSAASGRFLADRATEALPASLGRNFRQDSFGVDVEHARGHFVVRAEVVASRWSLPPVGTAPLQDPLPALGGFLEARYRLAPGVTVGARVDRLQFGDIQGTRGWNTWDADVSRVETGIEVIPRRHLSLRAVYQYNWRDTGRFNREEFVAAQLGVWF